MALHVCWSLNSGGSVELGLQYALSFGVVCNPLLRYHKVDVKIQLFDNKQTNKQTSKQTNKQTSKQTNKQANNKEANKRTYEQKNKQ